MATEGENKDAEASPAAEETPATASSPKKRAVRGYTGARHVDLHTNIHTRLHLA